VALEASGTIILTMGGRQEKVTFPSEQEMTGAVVRLMSEEVAVYFLTGHDEYSPEEFGDQSYSQVKSTLESKNYRVGMLNLLSANAIPDDAGLIIIAGPRRRSMSRRSTCCAITRMPVGRWWSCRSLRS
jgi:hypothetical protein